MDLNQYGDAYLDQMILLFFEVFKLKNVFPLNQKTRHQIAHV